MAKPITSLITFGTNPTPALSSLDSNFSTIQNAINDPASYTNYAIDTGSTNAMKWVQSGYNISGYANGQIFYVDVANTNTGSATLQVNTFAALPVYRANGSALVAGDLVANNIYGFLYNSALNSGSGGLNVFGLTGGQSALQYAVTFNSSGGAAAGSSFNNSANLTVSYATVGAPSTTGTNASGSWGISVTGSSASCTGNAATATTATTASTANSVPWSGITSNPFAMAYVSSTENGDNRPVSNDGYLTFSIGSAGCYRFEAMLFVQPAAGLSNIVCNINFSGTISNGYFIVETPYIEGSTTAGTSPVPGSYPVASSTGTNSFTFTTSGITMVKLTGVLLAGSGGTLAFAWGMSAGGYNGYLYAGSYMTVTAV